MRAFLFALILSLPALCAAAAPDQIVLFAKRAAELL
jgi:hypothetical protein